MTTALSLHAFSTVFMMGVIWLVQFVHYPSFHWLDRSRFNGAMKRHRIFTTTLVLPVMLCELFSGVALLFDETQALSPILVWGNLVALGIIWGSTFLVSVPLHEQLANGYNKNTVERLIWTNWPRTVLWSARATLFFFLLRPKWQS